MKVKCPFRLRYVPSGIGSNVIIRCEMHNHKLSKDLEGHDILDRLKDHERQFTDDMTKYNMTQRYIVAALKDKDSENLTSVTQVYKARATYYTSITVKLLNMFHLVLNFYYTYKTNRYWIPLLEIVGATSTKLTFLAGFAYLEHEREENFTWALEKLKKFFSSEKLLLKIVVMGRKLALMNAMEAVFPN
ncbi:uncharacterized protein LOC131605466 [Vicia villosa]|uniref:uncharacterized protein LOC131605466 n=1 Tax=Vicia villosa TaxID=3911 RepID=UPI00273C2FC4|nr:uncharacterized protein LOC131605466 [Vicia villosa]